MMRLSLLALCLVPLPAVAADRLAVVTAHADLGAAVFGDAATAAQSLETAVAELLANPSQQTLDEARAAWRAARVPYLQTEAFRFGNPVVDAWEGRVNSWPLDEGLIDYVAAPAATGENPHAALNVVATPRFTLSGRAVDATAISRDLLARTLHQADEVEANVATGYHAVEFLLWGQDLNGTGPGAGDRPWTDYAQGAACTHGNCDRRAEYLRAATGLLRADLDWMAAQWAPGGTARAAALADEDAGISAMLTGMGSLSYGELAGERIRLGLLLHDPEEEQDCFSDTTHISHHLDGIGIRNVYLGRYAALDGRVVSGPSLSELVAAADPALDRDLRAALDASVAALGAIRARAEAGMAYDQMLARGNAEGEALINAAVAALVAQTRLIERSVAALELAPVLLEGSDSLDSPASVFQ